MVPTFADFVTSMATLWCSQLSPFNPFGQYTPYPQPYPNNGFYPPDPVSGSSQSGAKVSVEITPPNRAHYNLQIYRPAASVRVPSLVSADPNSPSDTQHQPLVVSSNINNQRTTLKIDIPAIQAPGDYVGTVLDAQSKQPIGNLTVTVGSLISPATGTGAAKKNAPRKPRRKAKA
jgi:hypothetical protein